MHSTLCPLDPSLHQKCPCGKREMASLNNGQPRTSCADPVLTCGQACSKVITMKCGHDQTCTQPCHLGPCKSKSCTQVTCRPCRCGAEKVSVACDGSNKSDAAPLCTKMCTRKLSCNRHVCSTPCCIDASHECHRACGKRLKCGRHACTQPCHKGPCPPCLEASFDEYRCHCGKTTMVSFQFHFIYFFYFYRRRQSGAVKNCRNADIRVFERELAGTIRFCCTPALTANTRATTTKRLVRPVSFSCPSNVSAVKRW